MAFPDSPYIGSVIMFGGNFAPRGWSFCDGQLLAVSQNDALFSLLGTIYGGDGRTTFGLPDLRGRIPIHAGDGPGLSNRPLGSKGGIETVTLITNQLPSHSHTVNAHTTQGDQASPTGNYISQAKPGDKEFHTSANVQMATDSIGNKGGTQSHVNLMPTLCINYCIALVGVYPSRN